MANMEVVIHNMINALAGKYSFDANEAFEYIQLETDTNYLAEILKMASVEMPKQTIKVIEEDKGGAVGGAEDTSDVNEKIATCKKNIATWEKKLADGKAKDADKQREKIEKEKAKLAKLEKKVEGTETKKKNSTVEKKVEATEPKKKAAETEKKVAETKEKRIKRFSPVMASQLKKLLEDAKLEMNDAMKKDFQQYVENLSDTMYRESSLADHMRDFVKTKRKVDQTEKKVETESMEPVSNKSNAVGGGGPDVQILSLVDLQAIGTIASIDPPGTFWDADNGRFVRGPAAIEDEDFVEVKFEKKDFVVGEQSGRVYEAHDSGDVFAGFVGVGKFKGMKMP